MPKRTSDSIFDVPLSAHDHPLRTRGYRPELASVEISPTEDPRGEIAYQRAFVEFATRKRVPDPSLYPNSPSAQEYLKRKDEAIFSAKPGVVTSQASAQPRSPLSASTSRPQDRLPSPRNDDAHHPSRHGNGESRNDSGSSTPSRRTREHQLSPVPIGALQPEVLAQGIPHTMEPKLNAPPGPSRMLR